MEKLAEKEALTFTEDERKRIQEIKRSHEVVPFCSGCTLWIEMPLKDLFDETTKDIVARSAEGWFEAYHTIYYKKKKRKRGDG